MKPLSIKDSGFFVLRTPMLPVADYLGLDCHGPEVLNRPGFEAALYLASPDLCAEFDFWRKNPESERGLRVRRAVFRYFARMCSRATPFGTFAGCSVGRIGVRTQLRLADRAQARRESRLDMDYLATLLAWVEKDPSLRSDLTFRPNSSLYEVAGRWHYAESRIKKDGRRYHLVAVEKDRFLQHVLDSSRQGKRLTDIAYSLVAFDPDVEYSEALEFVGELAACQILVSDLSLPVTGESALLSVRDYVARQPSLARLTKPLSDIQAMLDALDSGPLDTGRDGYDELARELRQLPVPVAPNRMIQVDVFRPGVELELGEQPMQEIRRCVSLLHAITPTPPESPLVRFCDQFERRYGLAEIPLTEALDEEVGIGFMTSVAPAAHGSPVLAGLPLSPKSSSGRRAWLPWHDFLLQKLTTSLAAGRQEVELSERDIFAFAAKDRRPLPGAFSVFASISAPSASALAGGDFRIHVMGVSGPSGARMIGRFCHLDRNLLAQVEAHLREEEAVHPDAVFAELVHLPEGRIGNILFRPVLRRYEIPYLGKSGVGREDQIPVGDLLVSVRNRRVVLRSQRLNRQVLPRLTAAHGFLGRNLGLYKFLAYLQTQGVVGNCNWSWGPLTAAPRLPRVTCGRLVLAKASWRLAREEVDAFVDNVQLGDTDAIELWRESRGIPQVVELVEGDNCLVVDLTTCLGTDILADSIKEQAHAVLREVFPAPDELIVEGDGGAYTHELIVPMINTSVAAPASRYSALPVLPTASENPSRAFVPGSEWLYAKFYCGTVTADRLLEEIVAPLVQRLRASGLVSQWFFLRYGDPEWHVRLRLRGSQGKLAAAVVPLVSELTEDWLADRKLHRVQYETYRKETLRYGGARGIEEAERIFEASSEAVVGVMQAVGGDKGVNLRWRWALLGVDMMFDDLGFSLPEKLEILQTVRDSFFREFGGGKDLHRELGLRFRQSRDWVEDWLLGIDHGEDSFSQTRQVFLAMRRKWREPAAELISCHKAGQLVCPLADVATSLAHMHVNRMVRSAARAHELVISDFLCRSYRSRLARKSLAAGRAGVSE